MIRRTALLLLLIFGLSLAPAYAAPPKTISIAAYRAQLQKADAQLQQLEARAPRNIAPILQPLASNQIVKRADGQTQTAGGEQWQRFVDEFTPGAMPASPPLPVGKPKSAKPVKSVAVPAASREDVRRIRDTIALRLNALDLWSGSTYQSADAQSIIKQLENSGQIRTGPTWLEKAWTNLWKWVSQTFQKLLKWIEGWFPTVSPGKMPSFDPALIKLFFTLTVAALLLAVGLLIWRAMGGKIGQKRKRQGAFAFSPEDAELLSLPPDELRERANRFAAEGNFREALRHLYIALLLNFDTRGVWRYDARRTNWEHIAALKFDNAKSNLVAPLSDITRRFDRVRYGNAPCAQSEWLQFESDVSVLENSVSRN